MALSSGGQGSKSIVRIFANIFISFIGAGVLGLPYAFKEAGIIEGVTIMTLVGLISVKAMLLIIDCKYKLMTKHAHNGIKITNGTEEETKDLLNGGMGGDEPLLPEAPGKEITYGDVGFYALGHTGTLLVELAIVISQIGFCCAYLIFITQNIADLVQGIKVYHLLMVMLPVLGLLTLLRHLNSLALSSLLAQCSNLLAFAVVLWFDFDNFYAVKSIHPKKFSIEGLPFFLAIAIYCYEGAGMILSLESSVASEKRPKFKYYFKTTMVVVTFLYISFGVCGYLSFGEKTNAIITLNLPKGDSMDFALVVKMCLCLALFFTYPVMMFPVIRILESKIISKPEEKLWLGNFLRFGVVLLTGLIVMMIPNFANLMALVGAGCCTLLAFILPGVFHMQIFKGCLTKCQWYTDVFLVVLGMVGTVVGVIDALKRLTEGQHPDATSATILDNAIALLGNNISVTDNLTMLNNTT